MFSQEHFHSNYEKNSWGDKYVIVKDSGITMTPEDKFSFYTLKYNDILICDTKYENENQYLENNKVFCWFIFDEKREPLSGWVDIDDIIKYGGRNNEKEVEIK
jgi:hypothetical protein